MSHYDELTDQFSSLLNINMSPEEFENVWADISRGFKLQKQTDSIRRNKSAITPGLAASAAAIVAAVIGGTLVYKATSMSSGSGAHHQTHNKSTTQIHGPVSAIDLYYMKNLGFQPMSPSYIPSGWNLARSQLVMNDNDGKSSPSFSLEYHHQSASAKKLGPDVISIEEVSPTQRLNEQIPQWTKRTIQQDGLTVNLYAPRQWQQGAVAPRNMAAVFTKRGIEYMASYSSMTANTITTDEFFKILEGLTKPMQDKPIEVDVTASGTVSAASKVLTYKPLVPSFIPSGFHVGTGTDSPYGATQTQRGVPGPMNKKQSQFRLTYKNGAASIAIDAVYAEPDNLNVPQGNLVTVQGHQVRLKQEQYPGYILYDYEWYDPTTHAFYDVVGSDPSHKGLVDRTIMDKVIASMLG